LRKTININKNWKFSKTAPGSFDVFPEHWQSLDLPYTWNGKDGQDGGNDYYRGKCYFAKEIPGSDFENETAFLEFCGVNSSAEVFFNGISVGRHDGGYSTFRVKAEEIRENNILIVSADNSPNDRVYPQQADFTFYGGIYRDVNLITVGKDHFDLEYFGSAGVKVTPTVEGTSANVHMKAYVCGTGRVQYTIRKEEEIIACVLADDWNEAAVSLEDVHLWDGVKDPFLYTLEARLLDGEECVDLVTVRFGCRSFYIDPEKGFFLNGRAYPLRGVSRHQDRPDIGNALTKEMHKEDMKLIAEMGANTIRLAHYQHDQRFYDLCDEYGMVVWAEIPYISRHMPAGSDNTVSQMKELVIQNYHHPSICFWGLSNEITITGAEDPDLIRNHLELNELVHALDKTRLTTAAVVSMCSMDSQYVHISDLVAYNHYFGWYGGNVDMNGPWFDKFHKKYPDKPIGLSEYGAEALNWHTSLPEQGDYTEEYQAFYHEELIKQIDKRPYLWATHVWNMFDFAADARAEGGENGMNHKGLVSFDRRYKKDSFYAYKAWLNKELMLHLCSKRYVDRVEAVTKVKVYSNCPEVELFANGVSVGKQSKGEYPFFTFEVPNEGETCITAKAGELTDSAMIRKVDTLNESYIMKDERQIINWFEISTPPGYYSINDTIGDLMASMRGKIAMLKIILMLQKSMSGGNGGNVEVMGFDFGKLSMSVLKNLYGIAKGFTIKRGFMMLGEKVTKEQILEVNRMLNKVRKPRDKEA